MLYYSQSWWWSACWCILNIVSDFDMHTWFWRKLLLWAASLNAANHTLFCIEWLQKHSLIIRSREMASFINTMSRTCFLCGWLLFLHSFFLWKSESWGHFCAVHLCQLDSEDLYAINNQLKNLFGVSWEACRNKKAEWNSYNKVHERQNRVAPGSFRATEGLF